VEIREKKEDSHLTDILIIGGGVAGLTAAIYARRAGKSVLILEGTGFGGQIISSPLVENYPGLPAVSGSDYADALLKQVQELGVETVARQVREVERTQEGFQVRAGKKVFQGKSLILATGAKHRHLGIDREEELIGRGVSYCATCDGAFFTGQTVAVVGGGDSALQSALYLSSLCKTVYLIHRREQFRGEEALVERVREKENIHLYLSRTVEGLEGEETLTGLRLKDKTTGEEETLSVAGVFVSVGQAPDNGIFAGLVQLDAEGYFAVGEDCKTRTPGVFVAGDCRSKGLRQLTTAAADGAIAATAACQWLDM